MYNFFRRLIIYGGSLVGLALLSVVVTYEVRGPIAEGPSYSINDLIAVEAALHNYYLQIFTDNQPTYPPTLQDLVTRKYITQDQLDRLKSSYEIEYFHPPMPDKSGVQGDAVVFRARHRMPYITYSVGGHMRMKDAEVSGKAKKPEPEVIIQSDLP